VTAQLHLPHLHFAVVQSVDIGASVFILVEFGLFCLFLFFIVSSWGVELVFLCVSPFFSCVYSITMTIRLALELRGHPSLSPSSLPLIPSVR